MIPDPDTARQIEAHLRRRGHHVHVDANLSDDTVHVNVHMIVPLWAYLARWTAYLPLRAWRLVTRREPWA